MSSDVIDVRQVQRVLDSLNSENNREALFEGVRAVSNAIKEDAKRNLRRDVRGADGTARTGKPMSEGVQNKHRREYIESTVHILGDFRLKWFESGTQDRYNGKRNVYDKLTGGFTGLRRTIVKRRTESSRKRAVRYTGRIKGVRFFADARNSTDVDDVMTRAITKKLEEITGETL